MDDELTVPQTLALLTRRGVSEGFHVWSRTYGLPPGQGTDGWELVESDARYGWELRHWQDGRTGRTAAYGSESEACAALLQALLQGPDESREDVEAYQRLDELWAQTPWRLDPADRAALTAELARLGVSPTTYSLFGGRFEGRLCLEERTGNWRVFTVRNGLQEGQEPYKDEAAACRAFWRWLVDDRLPTMLGVRPSPARREAPGGTSEDDDLTIPEVLAIWDGIKPVGLHSPTYDLERPDLELNLHELSGGRWELRFSERGSTGVVGRFAREGDACAAILGPGVSSGARFASATTHKLAATHAGTAYEQLLYHWRMHPWRHEPADRGELAYLLRDTGFPLESYNLAGGRATDVLTIERRLDHWRVYEVVGQRRTRQHTYRTEAEACSVYWRRAVDEVIPTLVTPP